MPPVSDRFESPVVVLNPIEVPTAISSAMEACMFLAHWPQPGGSPSYVHAMKACMAAIGGEIAADTARGYFLTWAERRGIVATGIREFIVSGQDRGLVSA